MNYQVFIFSSLQSTCNAKCFSLTKTKLSVTDYSYVYNSFWRPDETYTSYGDDNIGTVADQLADSCGHDPYKEVDSGGSASAEAAALAARFWFVRVKGASRTCGGALVANSIVLTSTTCAVDARGVTLLGNENTGGGAVASAAELALAGRAYLPTSRQEQNDVALIKLQGDVKLLKPFEVACLAWQVPSSDCFVVDVGVSGNDVKVARVHAVPQKICALLARLLGASIDARTSCYQVADQDGGLGCPVGVGHPVICGWKDPGPAYLVGLTKASPSNCTADFPFFATNVYAFRGWVVTTVAYDGLRRQVFQ